MDNSPPRRVEDFTQACLWMGLVNLLWIFGAVWAAFGMVQVIMLAVLLNHLITRLAVYRATRS